MKITKRQLRRIIREATGRVRLTDTGDAFLDDDIEDEDPWASAGIGPDVPRDLEPKRFTGHKARKRAENAAGNLVFDEAERGEVVHVVSLGDGEYGLYFAEYDDGQDFYEDLPHSDPEAETVIQVPRSRAIVYGPRRDWGGSRVKRGRH